MPSPTGAPATLDARDIQGNLVGFNKDHLRLLYLSFPSATAGRAFLAAVTPREIDNAHEVLAVNAQIKEIEKVEHKDSDALQSSGVNLLLTFTGLSVLGAPDLAAFPPEFQQGMAARAASLGDTGASAPNTWVAPFTTPGVVHAMAVVAADTPELLDHRTATIEVMAAANGVVELGRQDGNARPAPNTGHEHFGFRDGISQPGIDGLTRSSKGGEPLAAGEFLIGYPDQDGTISGTPPPAPAVPPLPAGPSPTPGAPGYDPTAPVTPPAASPAALPTWAHNGSFVVFRRLRQDVTAFNAFLAAQAVTVGLTPEQLAAKLLGRWPSGAPMEHVPGRAPGTDNSVADPSAADVTVLHDEKINNFDYQERDADGHAVPRAAHIRKAWPRDETPPGHDEANRHRVLRRGLPYGPELTAGEPPYPGAGPVPDTQDRGLLFLCYQASIARGFEFIQSTWATNPDFPQPGDGTDPILNTAPVAAITIPGAANPHLAIASWVTTTGGEYFFAPSLSALVQLSDDPAANPVTALTAASETAEGPR